MYNNNEERYKWCDVMKLKLNSGEKPLWSQLYDVLEERILNGYYPTGTNLPSEMAIMEEFEVSRVTVRQAMDKLIVAGLIARKRGKGTIVLERKDKIETSFRSSFNGIHEKNNNRDRRVMCVEMCIPPVEVAYYFGISKNIKVLKIVRSIFVDNQRVSLHETYLNPSVPLTTENDFSGSLYKLLEQNSCKITGVTEKITSSLMNASEKKLFNRNKVEAVMKRERKGYSDNSPVEFTYSTYMSEGYELVIELS